MKSIDNGTPSPGSSMYWVCRNCPREVRLEADKNFDTDQWTIKRIAICVKHKDKEYILHCNYFTQTFEIIDCSKSTGGGIILRLGTMPDSITPNNAYHKFLTYTVFS